MAKEARNMEASEVVEAPPKQGGKKLLIVIILLLVVILIGGASAFLVMHRHSAEDADDDDEEVVEPVKHKKKAVKNTNPVYVAMEAFTVNLTSETGDQFVQVVLSVEIEDAEAGEQIKAYTPKIRNNVMLLLSTKRASELLTKEGKEQLAGEIRDQMNKVLSPNAKDAPVREVLFTSFIIQ